MLRSSNCNRSCALWCLRCRDLGGDQGPTESDLMPGQISATGHQRKSGGGGVRLQVDPTHHQADRCNRQRPSTRWPTPKIFGLLPPGRGRHSQQLCSVSAPAAVSAAVCTATTAVGALGQPPVMAGDQPPPPTSSDVLAPNKERSEGWISLLVSQGLRTRTPYTRTAPEDFRAPSHLRESPILDPSRIDPHIPTAKEHRGCLLRPGSWALPQQNPEVDEVNMQEAKVQGGGAAGALAFRASITSSRSAEPKPPGAPSPGCASSPSPRLVRAMSASALLGGQFNSFGDPGQSSAKFNLKQTKSGAIRFLSCRGRQ